ncbi:superoxide dismutase family protein [Pedobacter insulae]|uniref:Superoxide dismutase [Cu-Zn] n=1 Tax=Pedobacter insulae TaxID=414048 RepID=A0A1I2T0M5_9SPHI|nr:superoxide dismutase family protein [Pedobacter insulae]SFG58635.1 superoxide dismutase, Cu-Zn family [Pedobacter insulae]
MKHYLLIAGVALSTLVMSCKQNDKEVAQATLNSTATNEAIGTVKFVSVADGKIKMDLELNFPERADSVVAVHFHEHGDCGNMGENTHGHWNPTNENHGKWGSEAYHSGDIGNIELDSKGHATLSVTTDRWNTTENDVNSIIGRGIIVHGGTDDYTTQPTGNSGPRVGCGVIEAVK